MNNDGWRLTEDEWRGWLDTLMRTGKRIVAPVEKDGLTLFRQTSSVEDVSLEDYVNTRWSPKEFQFQNTETLFSYMFD